MEKKSFLVTGILSLILGPLGVHRFYTGYIGLGILQLFTFGGCGIWALIDFIMICCGKFKDAKGQELEEYNSKIGYTFLAVYIVLFILGICLNINTMNNLYRFMGNYDNKQLFNDINKTRNVIFKH